MQQSFIESPEKSFRCGAFCPRAHSEHVESGPLTLDAVMSEQHAKTEQFFRALFIW